VGLLRLLLERFFLAAGGFSGDDESAAADAWSVGVFGSGFFLFFGGLAAGSGKIVKFHLTPLLSRWFHCFLSRLILIALEK
jgi:hypothetical protein